MLFRFISFKLLEGTGGGPNQRDVIKVKKQNQQLSEENNLLKVKIEVLLDMVRSSCINFEDIF